MLPGGAAVVRTVHAVARCEIGADVGLAGADVDGLRIGGSNSECPDGGDGLVIEDRRPDGTGVGVLPNPAIHAAEVERAVAAGNTADGGDAARAERSDETPFESAEELRRDLLARCVAGNGDGERGERKNETR